MSRVLLIDVVTIFPEMLDGFLSESILGRARKKGLVEIRTINLRNFTEDAHRTTDDRPYGGGPGMVMKPEPIFRAVESVADSDSRVVLMTPQGERLTQKHAAGLSKEKHLIFVCGHYEGVDERVREHLADLELSIGDYVLTNGVLAGAVVIDAVVRLVPGALGCGDSAESESFSEGMLEYPQFTRPPEFRGRRVPEVLLSGNHKEIAGWRADQAKKRTIERRPDIMGKVNRCPVENKK
ncbi:MAG: tRNA (guanosine(37)-N1)-methyltransferase TrmD [Verrucomicrobiota bacterium]